jgi:ATP-dependent helicase/DNAse subunit B
MEAVRARVMQPLLELEAALEAAQSAAEMVGALYDYFERIDLKEQLDKKVLSLYGSGKLDLAEEYAQVWNRGVVELLEQAQQILGEGRAAFPSCAARWKRALIIDAGHYPHRD